MKNDEDRKLVMGLLEGSVSVENGEVAKAPHIVAFETHVQRLRSSPLFHLSLGSKELFHSNFLAWLCENYPPLMGPLFAKFTKTPCSSCDDLIVRREQNNRDLTITFPNGQSLIVENKVKSIANLEQLKEISDKAGNKKSTSFLLLSLIRPPFMPANDLMVQVGETSWHVLCYSDLVGQLESVVACISAINKYHGEIANDYLGFVRSLVAIATHVSVDWDNERAYFFKTHEHELLRNIRLYDLMDKIRYAQLAQKLTGALTSAGFCVQTEDEFKRDDAAPGAFMVKHDLFHGEALCHFSYLARGGENRVELGVMFQGAKVEVFVWAGHDIARITAEELLNPKTGGKVWFDLARIPGNSPEMPVKGFNQFRGKNGILFYRYREIFQITPKGLVGMLLDFASSIRNAEETIRSQINAAYDPV